jgi:integrase
VHLVPRFGDKDLRALDTEGIEGLRANLLERCAPKTTANVMSVLGSLFRAAVRWGYLEHNPMEGMPPLTVPPPPFDFWTAEETQRFLAAAEATESRFEPLFRFGLRTGLRLGELFAVEDHDLNLDGRRVLVQRSLVRGHLGVPKSGRAREVPLTGDLVGRLRLADWGRGTRRRLFTRPDGSPLTRGVIKGRFWRVTEAAGLRRIRLHDMRHSYASQLAMAGVPITAIQRFLGHADVRTTQRYAHLAPDALSEYVERLEWAG